MTEKRGQPTSYPTLESRDRALFIWMVVIGYAMTFFVAAISGDMDYSPEALIWGFLFGLIYLYIGLNENIFFGRLPGIWGAVVYFSVQSALVLGIGWVLGPGGNWLIGIPLVGVAVERLSPGWRWAVYIGVLAAVVLPIGLSHSDWISAVYNAVVVSAAIFFVVVVSQMRINEQIARQESERMTADLELANTLLAAYATQAEDMAMTRERNRLAREIHDNLGHYLTIVNVQIEAARTVMNSDPERAMDALEIAQELTRKGLSRVRESVQALRESPLGGRPIHEAIADLLSETQGAGIVTDLELIGTPCDLDEKIELTLFRAAQESLTNVRRHARASRVDIKIDFSNQGEVRLDIVDNGIGATRLDEGFGLLGMKERIQTLGGDIKVVTSKGKGFRLQISVPCSRGKVEAKEENGVSS